LLRGTYFAGAIVLCAVIVSLILMGLSYNGRCGGFFPELSAPRACSFLGYMFGDVVAISVIMISTFWPIVVVVLIVPPFVGYLLDRRSSS
jgi:hypothetical protein